MTLEPLLTAPWPVQLHVATVVPAALLGAWLILFSGKGSPAHRQLGRVYMLLMFTTSMLALLIHETNPRGPLGFSFIHLFVPITVISLVLAWRAALRGDMVRHKSAVIGSYIGGIVVAGGLSFLPGRVMFNVVWGS